MSTLPIQEDTLPIQEDTQTAINRLVRELLVQSVYVRMQDRMLDHSGGQLVVRMDTVLGLTDIKAEWRRDSEWDYHYDDIFADYQCCDRMEDHEYVDWYVILTLDVSVTHNGDEIGNASVGGVSLGWNHAHGGVDRLYLAQTMRDLADEALA